MKSGNDNGIETRRTLLSRLRNLDDQESWRTFFDRYWRLIYNVARRFGLEDSDAQDVVQETVIAVARRMPGFRYEPERGSFKQWLLRITQRRVADSLRNRYRQPLRADVPPETTDDDDTLPLLVVAPSCDQFDQTWNEEWERAIFDAAVDQVRKRANPKQFQVFQFCVVNEWPVTKVAATMNLNPAQVYLAKHRISQAVKKVARELAQGANPEGGLRSEF